MLASATSYSSERDQALRKGVSSRAASKGGWNGKVVRPSDSLDQWVKEHAEVTSDLVKHAESLQAALLRMQQDFEKLQASFGGYVDVAEESKASTSSAGVGAEAAPTSLRLLQSGTDYGPQIDHLVPTLPDLWPLSLKCRRGLEAQPAPTMDTNESANSGTIAGIRKSLPKRSNTHQRVGETALDTRMLVVRDPDSQFNTTRHNMTTLLLLYDAVLVPYVWGFSVVQEGWLAHQLFFMATFWTADMFLNLLAGFEEDGKLVLDLNRSIKRYLKYGFALDFFGVALDWTTAIILHIDEDVDGLARILRLLRMASLVRLRKLGQLVHERIFAADLGTKYSLLCFVTAILSGIVLFNHFQVCLWYYIGENFPTDTDARWIHMSVEVGGEMVPFLDLNAAFQYTSLFNWYMSQLTVGNLSIYATSTPERLFNIAGLLVGLMMGCALVSTLSAVLVNYQMTVSSKTHQLRVLHRYMAENHVSHETFVLAMKQARSHLTKTSRVTEKDVEALSLLSASVRAALQYEVSLPSLLSKPLFRLWTSMSPLSAEALCNEATVFEVAFPHEVIFEAGRDAVQTFHLYAGRGDYMMETDTSWVLFEKHQEVLTGQWVGEAALFVNWIHVGTWEALEPCQIFKVNVALWTSALATLSTFRDIAVEYAKIFYKRIIRAYPPHGQWPDDLHIPFASFAHIVASMSQRIQQIIGQEALQDAQAKSKLTDKKKIELLNQQVMNGKSVVFLDDEGTLKRVTSGVSLEVAGNFGKYLLQLGKVKRGGEVSPSCMVPGIMSERDELPVETVHRLLDAKLAPLAPHVNLSVPKQELDTRMSPDFGICTDYMQMRFEAVFNDGFDIPEEFAHGNQGTNIEDCLLHDGTGSLPMSPPLAFMFPGDKATFYCFAWLTHDQLAELKRREDLVRWWLQEVHRCSQADEGRRSQATEGAEPSASSAPEPTGGCRQDEGPTAAELQL